MSQLRKDLADLSAATAAGSASSGVRSDAEEKVSCPMQCAATRNDGISDCSEHLNPQSGWREWRGGSSSGLCHRQSSAGNSNLSCCSADCTTSNQTGWLRLALTLSALRLQDSSRLPHFTRAGGSLQLNIDIHKQVEAVKVVIYGEPVEDASASAVGGKAAPAVDAGAVEALARAMMAEVRVTDARGDLSYRQLSC